MTTTTRPILLIHGGAGRAANPDRAAEIHAAVQRIVAEAWPALRAGGALEAVVEAVRRLEDDPRFNAGTGSKLQRDGAARLSASLMDGARERFSGVVNVEGLLNPIALCRGLLEDADRVLMGEGALARARELGLREGDVRTERALAAWRAAAEGQTGTVGAVAVDADGRLAAATSTGGRGFERVGRVSDSCTIAGNYATAAAAVSCTGVGEHIVDGGLAARLVGAVEAGRGLEQAADALIARMNTRGWEAGFIAVDRAGGFVARRTTEAMTWCARTDDGVFGSWSEDERG